jgi:hypothetical protein
MPSDMKRMTFYESKRGANILHIETEGCIVNIQVGLTDAEGRKVTSVRILPEDEERGGDGDGRIWRVADDGTRIIRQSITPSEGECRFCGDYVQRADTDLLEAEGETADERRHCDVSRNHLHELAIIP